jgi:hypothetical protein
MTSDCLPPQVRATALAVLAASGRLASVGAQVVNGSLSHDEPTLLAVTSAVLAVGCIGALFVQPRN